MSVSKTGARRGSPAGGKHRFRNSDNRDFETFYQATRQVPSMACWSRELCLEVYQALQEWSDGEGIEHSNWLAAAEALEGKMQERRDGDDRRFFQREDSERRTHQK